MPNRRLETNLRQAVPVFAALGDDARLSIVARLSGGVPLSITRLTDGMPITRQAVTKHLHVLQHAGLVTGSKTGREQIWALNPTSLQEAQRCLELIGQQWESALGRFKAFVEK